MYFKVATEAEFLLTYHKLANVNSNLVSTSFTFLCLCRWHTVRYQSQKSTPKIDLKNRYRFLRLIFHTESTRDEKSAPKTNMAECNVKIMNFLYNLHLVPDITK